MAKLLRISKEISPSMVMHMIYLEENANPSREPQRRLNLAMQEVVRAKMIKLLDVGLYTHFLIASG